MPLVAPDAGELPAVEPGPHSGKATQVGAPALRVADIGDELPPGVHQEHEVGADDLVEFPGRVEHGLVVHLGDVHHPPQVGRLRRRAGQGGDEVVAQFREPLVRAQPPAQGAGHFVLGDPPDEPVHDQERKEDEAQGDGNHPQEESGPDRQAHQYFSLYGLPNLFLCRTNFLSSWISRV